MKEEITRIGGADGPTAVFIAGRNNGKISLKHRIQRFINKSRRAYIGKNIKADAHTLNQVCEYIVSVLGYKEMDSNLPEYQEEYNELRASYILQYKTELLGVLASAIIGYTSSYTDTFPEKDGETNFNREIGMPYAKVEEGIAVLYENEWHLCTSK